MGVLAQLTAWSGDAMPPFWRLTAPGGGSLTILGSIHFATPEIFPLPEPIQQAYADAGLVAFEVDLRLSSGFTSMQKMNTASRYPEEDELSRHLSPESYSRLHDAAVSLGFPPDYFFRTRPWSCANTLTITALRAAGFSPDLGIDRHFLNRAITDGKSILGLETPDDQLALFAAMSETEQEEYLDQALEDLSQVKSYAPRLLEAWNHGNTTALRELVVEGIAAIPALHTLFFLRRNESWCRQLETLAATHRSLFVVVGSGHLVGDDNLIEMLTRKEFTLCREPPPAKQPE